ncbi:MAG: PilZ domain-containing protein [Myxococcota bacterium]
MEYPKQRLRRLLVAHARSDAFAPHARSILSKMGYAIVPAEDLDSLPEPLPEQTPDLRIVDERRLAEIPEDQEGQSVPVIVISGRHGVTGADPRIVGAVPRPAGLHELYRLIQQVLEVTPRSTPRIPTHLAASCRRNGREWTCQVVSLSENGCLIRSPEPMPLGSHIELHFELPSSGTIETRAETAYQMPPDLGLIFNETPPKARRAIADFVSSALVES